MHCMDGPRGKPDEKKKKVSPFRENKRKKREEEVRYPKSQPRRAGNSSQT